MCQVINRFIVGGLLLFRAWLVLDLIPQWSVTNNEPGHIAAGLSNWYSGNYDLYRVNPPLPRMVATIPLLNEQIISLAAQTLVDHQPTERREIEVGQYFAYTNALYYHELVCRARLAGVFWITLGGFIVWRWSSSLFGSLGGLVSLVLWTFEPTLTAHAALATADVPATVMGLAATYSFAYLLRTGSWFHAFVCGSLLGMALLCKFTLLLLAPTWTLAYLFTRRLRDEHAFHAMSRRSQFNKVVLLSFLAWLTLNAGYEFDRTWTPVKEFHFASKQFRNISGLLENSWLSRLPCPVPAAYVTGIDLQQLDFEGRLMSYVRGEWHEGGWWWYYVYAFAIKTPLGHLAVYCLGIFTAIFYRQPIPALIWLSPLLIVSVASSKTGFTEHLRYILPAYPYIIILSGIVLSESIRPLRFLPRILVAGALLWSAVSIYASYPHMLGYFNETVGGSKQGWRHLAESNIDWGQDLIFLRDWITGHPELKPVYISLSCLIDQRLYLRQEYPSPKPTMSGYAVVDMEDLTRVHQWLLEYPIVDRIGTSIFVFRVVP